MSTPPAPLLDLESQWQSSQNPGMTVPAPPDWGVYGDWGERESIGPSHEIWASVPLDDTQRYDGHYPGMHERDLVHFIWESGEVANDAVEQARLEMREGPQGWERVLKSHGETVAEAFVRFDQPPDWIAWQRDAEYHDAPGLSASRVMSGEVKAGPKSVLGAPKHSRDPECKFGLFTTVPYPTESHPGALVIEAR
jgi:hypothetical protein